MHRPYHTYAIAGIISCIHVEYVAFTAYHPENISESGKKRRDTE